MKARMLDGKVAIITGASYGMGCAMAELFAEEGAKLVITARGKEQLDAEVEKIKKMGHEDVIGVVADNQYTEDIQRVIKTAVDAYGIWILYSTMPGSENRNPSKKQKMNGWSLSSR